jgi:outer membrane beta-barrel protein
VKVHGWIATNRGWGLALFLISATARAALVMEPPVEWPEASGGQELRDEISESHAATLDVDETGRSPAAYDDGDEAEYSFQWLDPDKKIYVIQNRRYTKKNRALLSVAGGKAFATAYRNSYAVDPRAAYYFAEELGLEAFYTVLFHSSNNTFQALQKSSPTTMPTIYEIRSMYGALLHWAPWYAKINVFNTVLYFDWHFAGGVGRVAGELDTNTRVGAQPVFVKKDYMGFFAGTGHQYHVTRSFVVRWDLTGAFWQAPLFGDSGDQTWFSNFDIALGLGLRL